MIVLRRINLRRIFKEFNCSEDDISRNNGSEEDICEEDFSKRNASGDYDIPEMNKSRARHSPLVAVFRADFKSDLHIVKYFLVAEWHACKVFCKNLFFNQK